MLPTIKLGQDAAGRLLRLRAIDHLRLELRLQGGKAVCEAFRALHVGAQCPVQRLGLCRFREHGEARLHSRSRKGAGEFRGERLRRGTVGQDAGRMDHAGAMIERELDGIKRKPRHPPDGCKGAIVARLFAGVKNGSDGEGRRAQGQNRRNRHGRRYALFAGRDGRGPLDDAGMERGDRIGEDGLARRDAGKERQECRVDCRRQRGGDRTASEDRRHDETRRCAQQHGLPAEVDLAQVATALAQGMSSKLDDG